MSGRDSDHTPLKSEDELRAIYDAGYVEQYDPHARRRIERMVPLFDLAARDKVADFGCGNGMLAEAIAGRVAEYVGVDFSAPFVQEAERRRTIQKLTNVSYYCQDIGTFCAERPGMFDAAFSLDVVEHVYDDTLRQMLTAIRGALKTSGRLFIHTPNGDYFMERLRARGVLPQIEGHVAVRNAAAYIHLLDACGFVDVRVHDLPHYLRVAGAFHPLGSLPIVGPAFRARLFITARKP